MSEVVQLKPRPIYETERDRENEERIGGLIAKAWHGTLYRNPQRASVDWLVKDLAGRVRVLLEVKDRTVGVKPYSMARLDELGGAMMTMDKWNAGISRSFTTGLPFVFAVQVVEGVFWTVCRRAVHDGIEIKGRKDRDDPLDEGPHALLRAHRFVGLYERFDDLIR